MIVVDMQTWPFHQPVSSKKIPDYHKIIKTPMDLQTMKKVTSKLAADSAADGHVLLSVQKCSSHQYMSRNSFELDMKQIVENSITYNGPSSPYTRTAEVMQAQGLARLQEVLPSPSPTIMPHTHLQDAELLGKLEKRVSGAASPSPLLKLLEGAHPLVADEMLLLDDLQHSSSSSAAEDSDSDDMDTQ